MTSNMASNRASRVNLALFGLGRMGMIHIENLTKNRNVNLQYIVDLDIEKAESLKVEYNLPNAIILHPDDQKTLFQDKSLDGVVICTPTNAHTDIVMDAIEAGKAVLCEKPLALTIESTLHCYKEAIKRNVPLLCAFNRRFDPQIQDLRKKREIVGGIQSIKTCSRDSPRPPLSYLKISGGIFHDCAVHDLDLIRWMIGEEPISVFSMAHAHIPEIAQLDDADTVYIMLKFPSGVIAHIDLSRDCKYGYHQTCEIFGENGSLMSDNPLKSAVHFGGLNGTVNDVLHHSFKQRYANAYEQEIVHFVDLITGKSEDCLVKPRDTLRATFLAQASEDSWRTGKVIDLSQHFKEVLQESGDDPLFWE